MRVLLDECMPRRFRRELPGFDVSHVLQEGWGGQRNGALLRLMLPAGFTHFVTVDRSLIHQQNIAAAGVAVVVLDARSNRAQDLAPLAEAVREALRAVERGRVAHLGV